MHARIQFARSILGTILCAFVACLLVSCEADDDEGAKDYGEYRVNNLSATTVALFVSGELRETAAPGQHKRTIAPDGLTEVSIRTDAGKVLWSQTAEVPDNAFAQFNVQPDLSVVLTAGNIAKPDYVGSSKRRVRLANQATYPADVLINGTLIGSVAPYYYATYDVDSGVITLSFRRSNTQKILFSQTMEIPKNAMFSYTLLPDGRVIATGGEIAPNINEQRSRYYYHTED